MGTVTLVVMRLGELDTVGLGDGNSVANCDEKGVALADMETGGKGVRVANADCCKELTGDPVLDNLLLLPANGNVGLTSIDGEFGVAGSDGIGSGLEGTLIW